MGTLLGETLERIEIFDRVTAIDAEGLARKSSSEPRKMPSMQPSLAADRVLSIGCRGKHSP